MFVPSDHTISEAQAKAAVGRAKLTGSVRNPSDRLAAIRLVKAGRPIGLYVRGVAVVVLDGDNARAAALINQMKGELRVGRPMAALLPLTALVELIDPERIPVHLQRIFLDPKELESRLGALCSVRVPVQAPVAAKLPSGLTARSENGALWLQSWVPDRESSVGRLVYEFQEQGFELPAVTSMNESGQPEIVDQREALAFCADHGVPFFLGDPETNSPVRGSFPILQIGPAGIAVVRHGHFPSGLFQKLLDGAVVDESHAQAAKYHLVKIGSVDTLTVPYALHDRLVALLDGVTGASTRNG